MIHSKKKFDTHFFFGKIIFDTNFVLAKIFLTQTYFFGKIFFDSNFFSTQIFFQQIFFWPKFFFGEIFFGLKFLFSKNYFDPIFLGIWDLDSSWPADHFDQFNWVLPSSLRFSSWFYYLNKYWPRQCSAICMETGRGGGRHSSRSHSMGPRTLGSVVPRTPPASLVVCCWYQRSRMYHPIVVEYDNTNNQRITTVTVRNYVPSDYIPNRF